MRIEAYTQVQKLYDNRKTTRAVAAGSAAASDRLQISSLGKDIQWVKQALSESGDIREDIVAPVKAKVQAGTYEVSTEHFADKLLEKFLEKYEELR